MNSYLYEEIAVGTAESFEVVVTDGMLELFKKLSGDTNPLHTDRDYAEKKGFSDRVVYGMLTASFYSRLIGVYLPGEHCLFQELEAKFSKPVYPGDKLTVSGTVSEKNDLFKRIVIKAEIRNSDGIKVSSAKIKAGVTA